MRFFLMSALLFSFTVPANAETYFWIDDGGTYNYTEDLSSVPKKYRKKVKRREDDAAVDAVDSAATGTLPDSDKGGRIKQSAPVSSARTSAVAEGAVPGSKQLFAGKTYDGWRAELGRHEEELGRIEQQLEGYKGALGSLETLPISERQKLVKEYNSLRLSYKQKYADYIVVVEAARKAGLVVNIK